mgnify:CR=1 FL=1
MATEAQIKARIDESFEPDARKKAVRYMGADTYQRYGKTVQVFKPLPEIQVCPEIEYRPQFGRREIPEMSSNAPFSVWMKRRDKWQPELIAESNPRIREFLDSKYGGDESGGETDYEVILRWQNSFDADDRFAEVESN